MTNPRLEIDLNKIKSNATTILNKCKKRNMSVIGITKSFCAYPPIVRALLESGIHIFADSRIQNIIHMKEAGINAEFMLLRIPMLSEVEKLVDYAEMSFNSENKVVKAISEEAQRKGKIHKVVMMVDVGDIREGVLPIDALDTAKQWIAMPNIQLVGIATNFGCYGGILPDKTNTSLLVGISKQIEQKTGEKMQIVSVGGTVALKMVEEGEMPEGISNIRIGEAITIGMDTSGMERLIEGTYQDAFTLFVEIVELKEKTSVPIGRLGYDAFTGVPKFVDKGIRKRAICGIGKQDLFLEALVPLLPDVEVLGASSDHLLLDVTDCPLELEVGSEVSFGITWANMLRLTTSPYVAKVIKE